MGDRHLEHYRCHQRYGPIVRYGPNRISANSNTALPEIYGFKANVQKSHLYQVSTDFMHEANTVSERDKTVHSRKKRVLSQALSDSAMKSMEDNMLIVVRKLCDRLAENSAVDDKKAASLNGAHRWTSAKNFANWSNYFSFDVMGILVFGKSYDLLDMDDNHYILELIQDGTQGIMTIGHMPGLLKLHLTEIIPNKFDKGMKRFKAYSKVQSNDRIRNDANIKIRDFYSYLLKARDPETGKGLSEDELLSEASILITAGSDTTSTAIAASIFYLLHNPVTLGILNDEIRTTFDTLEAIRSGVKLNSCRYLRACIDEALRCSPPVGGLMPREVLAGGVSVDGHHFPEGVDVGVPHYALHHHEAYYSDPFEFKPSRWLVGSEEGVTEESVQLAQSAFCAFSMGPRGCLGKGMAYMEMSIVLARMMWLFDLRLAEGSTLGEGHPTLAEGRRRKGEYQLIDTFVSKVDGPMVEFRLR